MRKSICLEHMSFKTVTRACVFGATGICDQGGEAVK